MPEEGHELELVAQATIEGKTRNGEKGAPVQ
jgi:hypothetical protein